jgi:hypothetical protein
MGDIVACPLLGVEGAGIGVGREVELPPVKPVVVRVEASLT